MRFRAQLRESLFMKLYRLAQMNDSNNPGFQKFTDRKWKIASVLESAAKRMAAAPRSRARRRRGGDALTGDVVPGRRWRRC